jgi:polyphosphate kinase
MEKPLRLIDRHLSWLSFNHRVLQEAANDANPVLERLRFLAIFSSNLDEFFRVRVPALYAMRDTGLLEAIRREVERQQREFGEIYLRNILPALHLYGIDFVTGAELDADQVAAARAYWQERVRVRIEPFFIERDGPVPFLYDRQLYLAVVLQAAASPERYAIVEIPARFESRFFEIPAAAGRRCFMFLDDLVRLHLPELFPDLTVAGAYSLKLTRDAELRIEDEFSGDLVAKIREALNRRATGTPSRLLYDPEMPAGCLRLIRQRLDLYPESLIPGWRYHNFSDFFEFPNPGLPQLEYQPMHPLRHAGLETASVFDAVHARDRILHYPYHSFDYVIRFLNEAADDPAVTAIHITLYRVAPNSEAVRPLIRAARNGKQVTAFVELKARFHEEANTLWADELRNAGARVVYSLPGFKVHCKMCLVARGMDGSENLYAYLGTGNFNEVTARIYTDIGLFTADARITQEVRKVFDYLALERYPGRFEHLVVAPFNMRQRLVALLDEEIRNAQEGKRAYVVLKLNNLEDPDMIAKLLQAAAAGVEVKLIVRSICCLPPNGVKAISIVGRFLEHSRVFVFHNGGDEQYLIGSADWMTRNLNRRVEVLFPIFDPEIRAEVRAILDTQLLDNVDARILDNELRNRFRPSDGPRIQSQMEIYSFLRSRSLADDDFESIHILSALVHDQLERTQRRY